MKKQNRRLIVLIFSIMVTLLLGISVNAETIDGNLFIKSSTIYNNNLANLAADISEEIESDNPNMSRFGFDKHYPNQIDSSNSYVSYIGSKDISVNNEEYTLLVIVARGTHDGNWEEMKNDFLHGVKVDDNDLGTKVWSNITNFNSKINSNIATFINNNPGTISKKPLKVLITGHSLGGAAANLCGAYCTKKGISSAKKKDIYVYTFGAIDVLSNQTGNITKGYENIHNIYNYYDSFGRNGSLKGLNVSRSGSKFGHTELYKNNSLHNDESGFSCNNHLMSNYKAALEGNYVSCKSNGASQNTKFTSFSKSTKSVRIKWKKVSNCSGYEVRCCESVPFKTGQIKKINKNTTTFTTFSGLDVDKDYYFEIRSYSIKGVSLPKYSEWSNAIKIIIKRDKEAETGEYMEKVINALRDDDLDTAEYYNSFLPKTASEKCVKNMSKAMKKAYKKKVQYWAKCKENGDYVFQDYYLTDFDNDSKAELIVKEGLYEAGITCHVYKYTNKIKLYCNFQGNFMGLIAYPKHKGVLNTSCRLGYWGATYIYSNNKKVYYEDIFSDDFDLGPYPKLFGCGLKSHSKNKNHRNVPLYSDLN